MRGLILAQFLVVLAAVLLNLAVTSHAFRIDCTVFVFAPKCRGVAAKRAEIAALRPAQPHSSDDFLDKRERLATSVSQSESAARILSNLQGLMRKFRMMADRSSYASEDPTYYVDDADLRP